MSTERRRDTRRQVSGRAVIDDGSGTARVCIIHDVSDTGAKLQVATAAELPDEFVMVLSVNGDVRRKCRVIWRTDSGVGVRFTDRRAVPRERISWRGERW